MPITTVSLTPAPTQTDQANARIALQINGPRVNVEVGIPDALAYQLASERPALSAAAQPPLPVPVVGQGLIDSGASNSAIDTSVAVSLGLSPLNEIRVRTPAGEVTQFVYGVKLSFPGHNLLSIPFLAAGGAELLNQGVCALIGRDFLVGKTFLYDGAASSFTISW